MVENHQFVNTESGVHFCTFCGAKMETTDDICMKCGCRRKNSPNTRMNVNRGLQVAAAVFMVLSCVSVVLCSLTLLGVLLVVNNLSSLVTVMFVPNYTDIILPGYFWLIALIPLVALLWVVPMTVYYFKSMKKKEPVGMAFKVCTLIFVNVIPGVLMLCDTTKANITETKELK